MEGDEPGRNEDSKETRFGSTGKTKGDLFASTSAAKMSFSIPTQRPSMNLEEVDNLRMISTEPQLCLALSNGCGRAWNREHQKTRSKRFGRVGGPSN